jgi:predicted Ser/Thr protein kinase/tetratricopeptide (TPR) repeat protein
VKLGRYEVVRELGKGAMGIVYLAKDPLIGRLVALKTIRISAHADDDEAKEFQQRFVREAQAAGILNHPAIVTVHDIGQDESLGTSFIAMEYVEGSNLKEVLAQGRTLTFDQIGDLISQVADALDFAHAKGIVHRDVKPANIILIEGNRAKITDFGIAKIASGGANLTTTGQFLGTPNYMAPEQIKGAPVDGRTDIFSLGICLYECLTRRKPFGGDSLTSISYKIVHEPYPPLNEVNPQIPEGFSDVVETCLAKDPTKRYQRARDIAAALRAVIRGERPVRPADPMLAEETMVTHDRREREKGSAAAAPPPMGTIEVPFPQAEELATPPSDAGSSTRPAPGMASSATAAPDPAAVKTTPRKPAARNFHKTLSNVRALPVWRSRIPPPLFIGVVALLVAGLIGFVTMMKSRTPSVPSRDIAAESRRAREHTLREEANALIRQGRVNDAYKKIEELQRIAPKSPFVNTMLQRLGAIRQQEELSKQQIATAQQKFQEGLAAFNEKKFPEAVQLFQESFSINPSSNETAEYLKLAQAEQLKADAAKPNRPRTPPQQQKTPAVVARTETASTSTQASAAPASLTTLFTHPFTDGRLVVRIGADIVVNEKIFDDKPARLFRRATRAPRPVNVTSSFPSKSADVQIWVTAPQQNVQEHHTLPAARFDSGSSHRLTIKYDEASKKFNYELN